MSGYTKLLATGKISFRQLALMCARKLGPFAFMEDRPFDEEPPKEIGVMLQNGDLDCGKAQDWVDRLSRVKHEDVEKFANAEMRERAKNSRSEIKKLDKEIDKIAAMEVKAREWEPSASLITVKEIMIAEIASSRSQRQKMMNIHLRRLQEKIEPGVYFQSLVEKACRDLSEAQDDLKAGTEEVASYKRLLSDLNNDLPE